MPGTPTSDQEKRVGEVLDCLLKDINARLHSMRRSTEEEEGDFAQLLALIQGIITAEGSAKEEEEWDSLSKLAKVLDLLKSRGLPDQEVARESLSHDIPATIVDKKLDAEKRRWVLCVRGPLEDNAASVQEEEGRTNVLSSVGNLFPRCLPGAAKIPLREIGLNGYETVTKTAEALQTASVVLLPISIGIDAVRMGYAIHEDVQKNEGPKKSAETAAEIGGSVAGGIAGGFAGSNVGSVVGGLIGGIFGAGVGAIPGAAVGGFIGGLAGSLGGGFGGGEVCRNITRKMMATKKNEGKDG